MSEYVKIYCCGDCAYYNWKQHVCSRGAGIEPKVSEHFYRDCPLGICNDEERASSPWISVKEELPEDFVSVLGHMTDAGPFPSVRECYKVGEIYFFPALGTYHPVDYWMPMPEPPKEEPTE